MSLRFAELPNGAGLGLQGPPPYATSLLTGLQGVQFTLPCEDRWVVDGKSDDHAYLDGVTRAWDEYPEWMDFLDEQSPCADLKAAERDLYLMHWKPWLRRTRRVLDIGCGIGRFALPLLKKGRDVWGVDADLKSLRRLVWRVADHPGRLDVHWSSAWQLPDVHDLDVVISCEVLCYIEDAAKVVREAVARLKPGGAFLLSVEARWGWATGQDAPTGSFAEALDGTGVLHIPGDRWVKTYGEDDVRSLLTNAGLQVELCLPTHYVLDGPLERCAPDEVDLAEIMAVEERCRTHPVWSRLNRTWTAVGVKPAAK